MAKKILIADDDLDQRDLYAELLKARGYDIILAVDGLEALEKALDEKPDLVFTGILMPRMDGFELIRNLRKNIATAQTPVILFSHLGREEDRQRAEELPGVELMVKGFDRPAKILDTIKNLVGSSGAPSPTIKTRTANLPAQATPQAKPVAKPALKPVKKAAPPPPKRSNPRRNRPGAGTIIV